jgi:hypothetical protein
MFLTVRFRQFFMTFRVGAVSESDARKRAGERELRALIREQSESVN